MDILSLIIFSPLLAAVAILLIPSERKDALRTTCVAGALVPLVLATKLWVDFDTTVASYQFGVSIDWIKSLGIQYSLGVDGLSIPMVWLAALLMFIAPFAAWKIEKGVKGFMLLLLLLETGILGVFCSLDLFLFYVFWEVMLLPMYFLIGIWGGKRREYAAIKFFLYTLAGSVLMLLGIVALYLCVRDVTPTPFSIPVLSEMVQSGQVTGANLINGGVLFGWPFLKWVFLFFFIAFAIKVPIVPFHTWLPDAHVEAPTSISMVLAGILLKLGCYGILRINLGMFPDIAMDFATIGAVIGVVSILYGAFVAMAQTDFKRMVAYSSVSHMGYVLLGASALTSAGLNGAAMQMFTHGTSSAMLFLLVGVAYDRAHHREIEGFGGLASVAPVYTGITTLGFFAALGLPGMSGFVSEFLVLVGSWGVYPVLTSLAVIGIVITAAFLLWTLQRVFLGPLNEKYKDFPDVDKREIFTLVPLAILCVLLGVVPQILLGHMEATMEQIRALFG
ncbi:MAG: NADH-quinone oxidoreductase subunit M [Planctomycetota bacterium]|jgi:NADH-quinone oxidoreductase subunit M|nr:NADH-quinone oxidoreductase subunit M [Planctomycetota bacterium]